MKVGVERGGEDVGIVGRERHIIKIYYMKKVYFRQIKKKHFNKNLMAE